MKKELAYMTIKYTKSDEKYIDGFISYLEQVSQEIIDFFNIDHLDNKISATLWDSLESFRDLYLKLNQDETKVPDWVCGFVHDRNVETLTLSEYRKTHGHENASIQGLMRLILHEFIHACHRSISSHKSYAWLSEGLATTISHQYDNSSMSFDATYKEMLNGGSNYCNYHTMFSYVKDTYGRDYVLKLINDFTFLEKETPRSFKETKNYVENKILKDISNKLP